MKLNDFKDSKNFEEKNLDARYIFYSVFYDNRTIELSPVIIKYDYRTNSFIKTDKENNNLSYFESTHDYPWLFISKVEAERKVNMLKASYSAVLSIMNDDKDKFYRNTAEIIRHYIGIDHHDISDVHEMQMHIFLNSVIGEDMELKIKDTTIGM